jgi:GT2 family glycosyltransferase
MGQTSLAYEVDWVGGACLLVRSTAVSSVGMLDESFFMYSEETDWCFRIKQQGWKVCYLSSAEMIHLGGGSASRASLTQLIRLYESKIHFFRKHYGTYQARLLRWGLVVANTVGLIRHALVWPLRPKEIEIRQRLNTRRELIWRLWHG